MQPTKRRASLVKGRRFTRREAALLAGVKLSTIDKAIEQRVLPVKNAGGQTVTDPDGIALVKILDLIGMPLPVKVKRTVRKWVVADKPYLAGDEPKLFVADALAVSCSTAVSEAARVALRYSELRDRFIEQNPRRRGGEPVISGTRLGVYGIAERIDRGETIETLCEDYPYVPVEAFETARTYAAAHPPLGRPVKPWRNPSD
ncbi:MAG: DUF433 domain-containing protein [Nitrososphaerales archaeon]